MTETLPPHFLDLVANALLHSFWRKKALRAFLRRMGIKDVFIDSWHADETKRDFIYRMFPSLEASEKGREALRRMARELADQMSFPDLDGWDDSTEKKARATEAVRAIKAYLSKHRKEVEDERAQVAARKRGLALSEERSKQRADLDKLRSRIDEMATRLGTQQAGYDFETWFYDLVNYYELTARPPYMHAGRQIDGSVSCDGTTYLIELKFTTDQAAATDVDVFYKKVSDKADNTMGIMVSIAGYSSVAIEGASIPKTPLLLLDHGHIYALLAGTVTMPDLIGRVRRHSSQTSQAYLAAADM
jgi:hypothetical protein